MSDQLPAKEISLVDLIAVILRYRRIIIGTALVSLFLSLVAILVIPSIKLKEPDNSLSGEAVADFLLTPDVQSFVEEDVLSGYITQTLTDPQVFLDAIKVANIDSFAGINMGMSDENALRNAMRQLLDENAGVFRLDQKIEGFDLYLKINESFDFNLFFSALLDLTNKRMEQLLHPYAGGKIWEYENVLLKEYPFVAVDEKLEHIYSRYTSASRFYVQSVPSLMMIQNPYTKKLTTSKYGLRDVILKKALIISIAAIFLSIFISFLLNWIDNVRNDSVSMEKLKRAVRRERS